jgi:hypothetical protein
MERLDLEHHYREANHYHHQRFGMERLDFQHYNSEANHHHQRFSMG